MKHSKLWVGVFLSIAAALGMLAWAATTVRDIHDRLAGVSPALAVSFVVVAIAGAAVFGLLAARILLKLSQQEKSVRKAPDSVVLAATEQADHTTRVIDRIRDQPTKTRLAADLADLRRDWSDKRLQVVVFGNVSAGKTSLINALLGREVGKTDALMGTTRAGETHTYTLKGVDGIVELTDTPGLSEAGSGGIEREAEARRLAASADLLLFVVDHDLTRGEYEPLVGLARQGKRSIVILNKKDRLLDDDRVAILAKLRERLAGVVAADDVVCVASSPRPIVVRVRKPDGSTETVLEVEPPDLGELRSRVGRILDREGDDLRAGNLLLQTHQIGREAEEQVTTERDVKAQAVIDKFQWMTAAAVFGNPVPLLDLLATGASQYQMISELAAVYGVEMSTSHSRTIGTQMIQTLLKLGIVEASTSVVAGLFKSTLAGYTVGGAIQGVSMAYLTHVSGHAFLDYFRHGQVWGDGGMSAAIEKQYQLASRSDFLKEFGKQALRHMSNRFFPGGPLS